MERAKRSTTAKRWRAAEKTQAELGRVVQHRFERELIQRNWQTNLQRGAHQRNKFGKKR